MKALTFGVCATFVLACAVSGCVADTTDDDGDVAASEEDWSANLLKYGNFEFNGTQLPSAWQVGDSGDSWVKTTPKGGYNGSKGIIVTDGVELESPVFVSQTIKVPKNANRFKLTARTKTDYAALNHPGSTQRLALKFLDGNQKVIQNATCFVGTPALHICKSVYSADPKASDTFTLVTVGGEGGAILPKQAEYIRVEIHGSTNSKAGESRIWDNITLKGEMAMMAPQP